MNMKKTLLIVILFCTGCSATKLAYQPQEYNDISKSIEVLKNSLTYQSPNHTVKSIEVKPDYFKIISGPRNKVSYVHFENIENIDFHEKREWKIITIKDKKRRILYRLYVRNREIAENFINAVYTLKNYDHKLETELNQTKKNNITENFKPTDRQIFSSTPETLEKLEAMKDLGFISEEEYQEKIKHH